MPSFRCIALCSLAAISTFAAPFEKRSNHTRCLNDEQAQQIATTWGTLISAFDANLAAAALTENFTDYSESVNTFINSCPTGNAAGMIPLLDPTFTARDTFIGAQSSQPVINFEQLNIWHSCDTVIIRWKTTNTANITEVKPVIGLISMETVTAPKGSQFPYLIDTLYSEFDAGAWLQNLVEAGMCAGGAGLSSTSSETESATAPTSSGASTAGLSPTGAPVLTGTAGPSNSSASSSSTSCETSTPASYGATVTVSTETTTFVTQTATAYA